MNSFFRIVTSNQWEEAQITGIIPTSSENSEAGEIAVCQFKDLERVCGTHFSAKDFPLALEFSPSSFPDKLDWQGAGGVDESMDTGTIRNQQGILKENSLASDYVLNLYAFEAQEEEGKTNFILQGEKL